MIPRDETEVPCKGVPAMLAERDVELAFLLKAAEPLQPVRFKYRRWMALSRSLLGRSLGVR